MLNLNYKATQACSQAFSQHCYGHQGAMLPFSLPVDFSIQSNTQLFGFYVKNMTSFPTKTFLITVPLVTMVPAFYCTDCYSIIFTLQNTSKKKIKPLREHLLNSMWNPHRRLINVSRYCATQMFLLISLFDLIFTSVYFLMPLPHTLIGFLLQWSVKLYSSVYEILIESFYCVDCRKIRAVTEKSLWGTNK